MDWLANLDGRKSHFPLLEFLGLYAIDLVMVASAAQGWGPLHTDMTEMWAWGQEFQLSYDKHPPFAAWLAGLWFSFMPRTHWSFYLLAALNGAAGLAGVWALAGLFLNTLGRWTAMLLLVLTPSFTLAALKYNANAPLLSLWPWCAYFFVKSLQTGRGMPSAAAGFLGAAALLTKYYSVVLFATFFFVALLHPDRRRYFFSAAPYIVVAVGLATIAPMCGGCTRMALARSNTRCQRPSTISAKRAGKRSRPLC